MPKVTVNGVPHEGSRIVIRDSAVIVDGRDVTPDARELDIRVPDGVAVVDIAALKFGSHAVHIHLSG